MNHPESNQSATPNGRGTWERVAAAHRDALSGAEQDLTPPLGFSTRVVARWAELRENERVCFWARWSLRAALCGTAAACLVLLLARHQDRQPLLTPPALDLPGLSPS